MITAKLSAIVAGTVVIGVLVWNPLTTRGQTRMPDSVAVAATAPSAVNSTHLLANVAKIGAVATIAQTVAVKTVDASALDVVEFRPLDRDRAAATYPLPERKYIRSGLWKVGTTELGRHYHTFDCPQMRRSSRNYIYGFPDWREAQVAGYQPDIVCTPSPLHEFIAQVREARRKITQSGQPASAVTDTELMRIRSETGSQNVSEKILGAVLRKMLGRAVTVAPPGAETLAPQGEQGTAGEGGGAAGGLPQGSGSAGAPGGMGSGPMMGGMSGGARGGSRMQGS